MLTTESLWNFSIAYYSLPGKADICLALQDSKGMDVNVLLFLLWQAQRRRRLSRADIESVVDFGKSWRTSVVQPLRGVRRFLKHPGPSWEGDEIRTFRERIKGEELFAERVQQNAMAAAFPNLGQDSAMLPAARENLALYADLLAVSLTDCELAALSKDLRQEA
jgi:uncharacterized protein (TIGR02444 family)